MRQIHHVEQCVSVSLNPKIVRCRMRQRAIVIELDAQTLTRLDEHSKLQLTLAVSPVRDACVMLPAGTNVLYEPYRVGSAFLRT